MYHNDESVFLNQTKKNFKATSTSSQSMTLKPLFIIRKCLNGASLKKYIGIPYCVCLEDFYGPIKIVKY
ncbi:hypothetical protein BpHYR1_020043, partial [Brachionus plicatilis]